VGSSPFFNVKHVRLLAYQENFQVPAKTGEERASNWGTNSDGLHYLKGKAGDWGVR